MADLWLTSRPSFRDLRGMFRGAVKSRNGILLAHYSCTMEKNEQKPARTFERILVPVDFSACAEAAFRLALSLARVYQSEVVLMHVIDRRALAALNRAGLATPSEEKGQIRRLRHHARLNTRQLLALEEAKGVSIRRALAEGVPFVEIAKLARSEKVGLVVMGSYGGTVGNVDKIFFGSTAEKVVRTAGCPVLTVPLAARPMPRAAHA